MPRYYLGALIVSLFVQSPLLAQNPNDSKLKPMEMEARFHDGSIICKMEIKTDVEVATKDGKVTVPARDIHRIDFRLRLPKEVAARIAQAVGRLGSANYAQRESASKELTALAYRAGPALQAAAKSKDLEAASRAAAALSKIRETAAPELLLLKEHDVIHTRDKIIMGCIHDSTMNVRARSSGEMSLELADLISVGEITEVTVGAGLFGEPIQWRDTGILVESGMGIVIRASGEIVHPRGSGVQLVTAPEGRFPFYFITTPQGRFTFQLRKHHPPGTLVGKIGDQSEHFVIGKHFEGKANLKGHLFLWVVPWFEGQKKPTGAYRVGVTIGANVGANLAPCNEATEAAFKTKSELRQTNLDEVIHWKEEMDRPNFDPKQKNRYERGIQKSREDIENLNKEIRKEFSHILYPGQWLERPTFQYFGFIGMNK